MTATRSRPIAARQGHLCDSVEPRNFWLHRTETNRLSFMRLYDKPGSAAFEASPWYF